MKLIIKLFSAVYYGQAAVYRMEEEEEEKTSEKHGQLIKRNAFQARWK